MTEYQPPRIKCLFCDYFSFNHGDTQKHMIDEHFDGDPKKYFPTRWVKKDTH